MSNEIKEVIEIGCAMNGVIYPKDTSQPRIEVGDRWFLKHTPRIGGFLYVLDNGHYTYCPRDFHMTVMAK